MPKFSVRLLWRKAYWPDASNSRPMSSLRKPAVGAFTVADADPLYTLSWTEETRSHSCWNRRVRGLAGARSRLILSILIFSKPNKSVMPKALWLLGYCWSKVPIRVELVVVFGLPEAYLYSPARRGFQLTRSAP